jgi:hypothetical protein
MSAGISDCQDSNIPINIFLQKLNRHLIAGPKACDTGAHVPTYTHPRGGLLKERASRHPKVSVSQRNRHQQNLWETMLYADHVKMYGTSCIFTSQLRQFDPIYSSLLRLRLRSKRKSKDEI